MTDPPRCLRPIQKIKRKHLQIYNKLCISCCFIYWLDIFMVHVVVYAWFIVFIVFRSWYDHVLQFQYFKRRYNDDVFNLLFSFSFSALRSEHFNEALHLFPLFVQWLSARWMDIKYLETWLFGQTPLNPTYAPSIHTHTHTCWENTKNIDRMVSKAAAGIVSTIHTKAQANRQFFMAKHTHTHTFSKGENGRDETKRAGCIYWNAPKWLWTEKTGFPLQFIGYYRRHHQNHQNHQNHRHRHCHCHPTQSHWIIAHSNTVSNMPRTIVDNQCIHSKVTGSFIHSYVEEWVSLDR